MVIGASRVLYDRGRSGSRPAGSDRRPELRGARRHPVGRAAGGQAADSRHRSGGCDPAGMFVTRSATTRTAAPRAGSTRSGTGRPSYGAGDPGGVCAPASSCCGSGACAPAALPAHAFAQAPAAPARRLWCMWSATTTTGMAGRPRRHRPFGSQSLSTGQRLGLTSPVHKGRYKVSPASQASYRPFRWRSASAKPGLKWRAAAAVERRSRGCGLGPGAGTSQVT